MLVNGKTALLTLTENANVLSGSQYEFLPFNGLLEFGLVGSATGLVVNVTVGTEVVLFEGIPSEANRYPVYPDDYIVNAVSLAGARIVIKVRNPTGGTLTLFWALKITQL